MNEEAPRHPGAQTMAAFLDGKLTGNEIAAVSAHLSGCGECRIVVAETAGFEREEESRNRTPRAWWLAVAAVLAGVAVTIPFFRPDPIARMVRSAPADHRLLEPRLARFPWARLQQPPRGPSVPDPADLKLTGTAGEVLQEMQDRQDAKARHASGVAYLLIGRANDSVAALEDAAQTSKDWQPWNDLAAARYAAATSGKRPSQLPQALADADHALRLSPNAAEARFNRALIIEAMGLEDAARDAWEQYLTIDPSSQWSAEARKHLGRVQRRSSSFDPKLLDTMQPDALVRRFPADARRAGEGSLLAEWADAEAAQDQTRATALLARARAIGNALARLKSEGLLADAVAAIERADPATRAVLAVAHRTYRDARIDNQRNRFGAAEKQFRSAAASFQRGGSPMADVASYYAASAAFNQSRVDEARRELAELLLRVDPRHLALRAQIEWELAVCSNAAGDWGSATRYATDSIKRFRSLGEQVDALFVDSVAAMAVEMIGEGDQAWQLRVQTVAGLSAANQQGMMASIVHTAAMTLAATGRTPAAASVVDLLVAYDLSPEQTASTSADSARYAARNGDFDRAQRALDRARANEQKVEDPALRKSVHAQIELADATCRTGRDPQSAIAALDQSIEFFAKGEARIDLPDAYLQRARARHTAGHDVDALADYASALQEVEKQRTTVRDAESRLRFLDIAANIIEETVDLRLTRGDVAGAFAVADRARTLIDPQPVNSTTPPVSALPQGVLVVEYAVLPQRTVAFCVSRRGIVAESMEIERRVLETQVSGFAERIRRRVRVEDLQEESSALRRLLIEPLRSQLAGVRTLIIVPDRQLHALPFAALWNAETKQYLVEEYTLRFAPSAAFSRGLAAQSPQQAALVIADPPAAEYPSLPASREEALAIAAMYDGATLLSGEAATRTAFVESARRSSLIHFAGHANSDATTSHGALLFAGAGDDSGILGSSEVAQLRLERNPLVVLAACGTLRGDALHVAGMSSLSRAFLVAGARGVVGTLWEVDDDVSAALFRRFHAHLRAGMPPAEALRAAQVDALRSPDPRLGHPATWSPVELLTDV
jgi:CHAT domain-containing protein